MKRATWTPAEAEWLATNAHGLPPEPVPYTHASQRLPRHPGKDAGRPQTDPWLTAEFKAAHPGLGRGELALAWLREEFS